VVGILHTLIASILGWEKIDQDQLTDYAQRKGMSLEEASRWLRPILD
jgi:5-methyltetrahydrofolate--homocysteine methyltransferase